MVSAINFQIEKYMYFKLIPLKQLNRSYCELQPKLNFSK
jgi:hypothetical protein